MEIDDSKVNKPLIIVTVFVFLLVAVWYIYRFFIIGSPQAIPVEPTPEPVACAQDVRICPDGSSVSRIPPNCEFEECPYHNPNATNSATTEPESVNIGM